jgi:hypothetical protein
MGKVTDHPTMMQRRKMGRLGFEPRTCRLKAGYSTVELATRVVRKFLFLNTVFNHNTGFSKRQEKKKFF